MRDIVQATVCAIIEKNGKILLGLRKHGKFSEYWACPGGHIEGNETAKKAIERELTEETKLKLAATFLFHQREYIPKQECNNIVLWFTGKVIGKIKDEQGEFGQDGWFTKKEIQKKKAVFKHKQAIKKYFESKNTKK